MNLANSILAALPLSAVLPAAEAPPSMPLWPGGAPGSEGRRDKEVDAVSDSGEMRVTNIHAPTPPRSGREVHLQDRGRVLRRHAARDAAHSQPRGGVGIDPSRVGALGFSAGGELVWQIGTRFDAGDPAAPDPIERERSKPDFQPLIYPGRSGDIQPTKDSPPAAVISSTFKPAAS